MALIVQNDAGSVVDANSYVDLAFFKTYCSTRGYALTGFIDPKLEEALVRGRDYMDLRWRWLGDPVLLTQETEWPRANIVLIDNTVLSVIPYQIKRAQCEYSFRALTSTLLPDKTVDSSGRVVVMKKERVDKLEEETQYAVGGATAYPEYPAADRIIRRSGFIRYNSRVMRA